MTEAELFTLFLAVNQDIDTQFQFWLSITFAVLVASFVADERLSRKERIIIAIVYLSAAAILLMRYSSAVAYQFRVLEMFDSNGVTRPAVAGVAGGLRYGLFTFGSLIAAVSVVFPRFGGRRGETLENRQSDGR